MQPCRTLAAIAVLLAALAPAWAGEFSHKDWMLACDNTRTCRAAGYQPGQDVDNAVSVLLTRKAGAGEPVTGEIVLGEPEEGRSSPAEVRMAIAGRDFGAVAIDQADHGKLRPAQVQALLAALAGRPEIAFTAGDRRWLLSTDGASAVLLKMDEAQGRLGTRTALARKGPADDSRVLPALPRPVLQVPPLPPTRPADAALAARIRPHLKQPEDACDELPAFQDAQVWRLAADRVLLRAVCWRGAYNEGYGFWVAADRPPYDPVLVTTDASDFDGDGRIVGSQKGRGPGDCIVYEEWAWDGKRFVHARSGSTGLCRGVQAGGAWELPTIVTDVRVPSHTEEKRK